MIEQGVGRAANEEQKNLLADVRSRIATGSDSNVVALERKMSKWNDSDSRTGEGVWQLWTICRGCGELFYCHGRERDRVRCLRCYLDDVEPVPLFELGIWEYDSGPDAVARGRQVLQERKEATREASRRNLERAQAEKKRQREERDSHIASLLDEHGYTAAEVADDEGLSVSAVQRAAARGRQASSVQ